MGKVANRVAPETGAVHRSATAAEDWLIDSGATDHMTPYRSDFEDYTRLVC